VTTTYDWIEQTTERLKVADIETARLDSMVLLEDTTGKDRAWLLAHPEFVLSPQALNKLEECVKRRLAHEPLAYIRGKCEFYGREFIVNSHSLQPRSETETMIDILKPFVRDKIRNNIGKKLQIIDIGTGSGALAVTAKLEIPESTVFATDIDANCLKTARKNAKKLTSDISFLVGDLLEPLPDNLFKDSYSIILANLPYVPDFHTINKAAEHEPKLAIFGGPDGLDLYRNLFDQINLLAHQPRVILTESMGHQHIALASIASNAKFLQVQAQGYIQQFTLEEQHQE
jgi:release factor glutamine methyltransferase